MTALRPHPNGHSGERRNTADTDRAVATLATAAAERARLAATLVAAGLYLRPEDTWQADELALAAGSLADLLRAARWTPAACRAALGGPLTVARDCSAPIITAAAGTRFPVLGLYDANRRLLTVNDWSFDARTDGAAQGRRVLLHELAHAWDRCAGHWLACGIAVLPGPRASTYAAASPFEDWAEAVMGAVYGADPGHERFERSPAGHPSPRLRYVCWAFARYRRRATKR